MRRLVDFGTFKGDPAHDTRQYKTHAEWCAYLAARGQLAAPHRSCQFQSKCVAKDKNRNRVVAS